MELDGQKKQAVEELCSAVNTAIEQSPSVADAIDNLRRMGLEPNLSLKLELVLESLPEPLAEDPDDVPELELTEEDLRTLQRMKIKI